MRISAKGRYALAAVTDMAQQYDTGSHITVISISERLGVSKIYLEQVFSLLKRGGVVSSAKGAQGGYSLLRAPSQITVLDVLSAVETSLFEKTSVTMPEKSENIERAMQSIVFTELDRTVSTLLKSVTLSDLVSEAEKHFQDHSFMFYI